VPDLIQRIVEQFSGKPTVLFRGQRNIKWDLTPRLGRTYLRQRYQSRSVIEVEQLMLDEFERLAIPFIGNKLLTKWDQLALAQHHGLPTRLLDWTSNPLIALWFAIQHIPEEKGSAVVWAYETSETDIVDINRQLPNEIGKTMVFRPKHHDSRIIAQSGWFTVHAYMPNKLRFSSLHLIPEQRSKLIKFKIPFNYFSGIREDLSLCGVNSMSLFPDLSGLTKHLEWQFSPAEDEIPYDKTGWGSMS